MEIFLRTRESEQALSAQMSFSMPKVEGVKILGPSNLSLAMLIRHLAALPRRRASSGHSGTKVMDVGVNSPSSCRGVGNNASMDLTNFVSQQASRRAGVVRFKPASTRTRWERVSRSHEGEAGRSIRAEKADSMAMRH